MSGQPASILGVGVLSAFNDERGRSQQTERFALQAAKAAGVATHPDPELGRWHFSVHRLRLHPRRHCAAQRLG